LPSVLHCFEPGTHMPVQLPPEQTNGQTAPLLAQCPPLSQSCGWFALQRLAPGEQSTQVPLPRQTLAQVVVACHWPLELHVSATLPLHRALPGVQTPVHAPDAHTN
jgi:hypothetical protein